MNDDVSRGLALLADEAEPAPVDPYDVITRARVISRNRRATAAAAFATVALVGALAVTVGNPDRHERTTAATTPEDLTDRMNRQLTEALPDLIPSRWSPVDDPNVEGPAPRFTCEPAPATPTSYRCHLHAVYDDGHGALRFGISADKIERDFLNSCDEEYCDLWGPALEEKLPDGTRAKSFTYTEKVTPRDSQTLLVERPDGSQVAVNVTWQQGQRSEPPLSGEEILKFATVFSLGDGVPEASFEEGDTLGPDVTRVPYDTSVPDGASADPTRAERLDQDLTAVVAAVIPAGWSAANEEARPFRCALTTWLPADPPYTPGPNNGPPESEGCAAYGAYTDATGRISFQITVSQQSMYLTDACDPPSCVEYTMPDDTRTRERTSYSEPIATHNHELAAMQANGTYVWVRFSWKEQRSGTPLTRDQLLEFARAFTF